MPYPNSFKEFVAEVFQDAFSKEDPPIDEVKDLVDRMDSLLKNFKEDAKRGNLAEVLGLGKSRLESDYIEAAFRTLILDLFPGPSYKPAEQPPDLSKK